MRSRPNSRLSGRVRPIAALCTSVRARGAIAPLMLTRQANGLPFIVRGRCARDSRRRGCGRACRRSAALRKIHRGVVRLVFVGAPAVKDGFAIACRSTKYANLGIPIQQPDDVARFGLGGGPRPDVRLEVARQMRALDRARREMTVEAPHHREVAIEVDADGPCSRVRAARDDGSSATSAAAPC